MGSAKPKQQLVVVVVLMVMIMGIGYCKAQLCKMTAAELKACRPSVSGSKPEPPSSVCCSGLRHADLKCFCMFYKDTELMSSLGIDPELAQQLPEKCNCPQPTVNC